MIETELVLEDLVSIDVWVTPDVKIIRQEGMFFDAEKTFLFAPTRLRGFVVVTSANSRVGCRPLYAFTLFRPAAITLSFVTDRVVNFRKLDRMEAITWAKSARTAFKRINKRSRTTSQKVRNTTEMPV